MDAQVKADMGKRKGELERGDLMKEGEGEGNGDSVQGGDVLPSERAVVMLHGYGAGSACAYMISSLNESKTDLKVGD